MLLQLKITNIALIEDIDIEFTKGLNILSGETGAGKSIILDAIALISGEHARTELIRTGKEEARIFALFDLSDNTRIKPLLENLGVNTQENILIIERYIYRDKRPSLAFINHQRALIGLLKEIGYLLIDIHSQHENQALFDAHKHLEILDIHQDLTSYVEEYQRGFQQAISLKREIQQLKDQKQNQQEQESFYQYQLQELEAGEFSVQEWKKLVDQIANIDAGIEYQNELNHLYDILYGASSKTVMGQLQEVQYIFDKPLFHEKIEEQRELLQDILAKLEDILEYIRQQKDHTSISSEEMEEKNKRYLFLQDLQTRYRKTIAELVLYQEELQTKISCSDAIQDQIDILEQEQLSLKNRLIQEALWISKKRHEGAHALQELIKQELKDLSMQNTEFEIRFQSLTDDHSDIVLPTGDRVRLLREGLERAEFFVSFNLGEEKKSLAKIGSGGEISRLTLALKNILHQVSPVETQIFDEVDSGIGGETAFAVGKKLLEIAQKRQVICISHLPQIAAMGHLQFVVHKETFDGRTQTQIHQLNESERVEEISRMLSGESKTSISLDHAQELLNFKNSKNI